MVIMVLSIPIAFLIAIIWPWFQYALVSFDKLVSSGDSWAIPGAFLYALINRLVQPTGLHHIINTFLWFQMPINGFIVDFSGKVVLFNNMYDNPLLTNSEVLSSTGLDVMRQISDSILGGVNITNENFKQYFSIQISGVPNNILLTTVNNVPSFTIFGDINAFKKSMVSGNFQTGYFPMFWGGLPGAALAMIYSAKKEKRKEVTTFLAATAVAAALTGIDEPLVFSFIFVGPILLLVNALFTAMFAAFSIAMHMHVGFGFSGGFIDYIISFANSWGMSKYEGMVNGSTYGVLSNLLWMFALSGLALPTYFFTFKIFIKKMNIKTPGREDEKEAVKLVKNNSKDKYLKMAEGIVDIVKIDNILKVEDCSTRLRLTVKNSKQGIEDKDLKALVIYGIKRLGDQGLQLIIGTDVEHVANEVQTLFLVNEKNKNKKET